MHPHRILSTLCCNAQHAPTAHPAPADEVGVTPGLLGSWACQLFSLGAQAAGHAEELWLIPYLDRAPWPPAKNHHHPEV